MVKDGGSHRDHRPDSDSNHQAGTGPLKGPLRRERHPSRRSPSHALRLPPRGQLLWCRLPPRAPPRGCRGQRDLGELSAHGLPGLRVCGGPRGEPRRRGPGRQALYPRSRWTQVRRRDPRCPTSMGVPGVQRGAVLRGLRQGWLPERSRQRDGGRGAAGPPPRAWAPRRCATTATQLPRRPCRPYSCDGRRAEVERERLEHAD